MESFWCQLTHIYMANGHQNEQREIFCWMGDRNGSQSVKISHQQSTKVLLKIYSLTWSFTQKSRLVKHKLKPAVVVICRILTNCKHENVYVGQPLPLAVAWPQDLRGVADPSSRAPTHYHHNVSH